MDWLRVFVAGWAILVMWNTVYAVLHVGQERKPNTPTDAGCLVLMNAVTFVGFLLVWARLGA